MTENKHLKKYVL